MELREPLLEASEPLLEARDPRLLLEDTVRELADRLRRKSEQQRGRLKPSAEQRARHRSQSQGSTSSAASEGRW